MNAEEFVARVVGSVSDHPGLPRLRLVFADLIEHENIVLMGGKGLNYSRHKDHKIRSSSSHIFMPCHSDYTEHKDHR